MKIINILFYKKGLAGNLIKFLMSLDKRSFPYYPNNVKFDENEPRINYLSFANIKWRYGSWKNFHLAYQGTSASQFGHSKDFEKFIQSDYQNLTLYGHHKDMDNFVITNQERLSNYKVNYLTIKTSPEYDCVLEDFIKDNGIWFQTEEYVDKKFKLLEEKYQPYFINLDNMYKGTQTFIKEYNKLIAFSGLESQLNDALIIYKDWAKSRGLYRYNFFKE